METLIPQIAELLNNTLSPDHTIVGSATEALDRLSLLPDFPSSLISIATGGEDQGQRISAATYLKNFIRRNVDADDSASKVTAEFRNRLVHASLLAEPAVLKVLVEAFRAIVVKEFVKENTWPELVPELRSVIQNSNYISESPDSQWKTINALTILQSILRPFQYFLNPSLKKEPVPPQLELIGKEILVPLLAVFHNFVEKALSVKGRTEIDLEKILLLVCKCIYFSVRSHMPSALSAALPSFCQDLFRILNSLGFSTTTEDDYSIRVKTGKRSLLIFRALVTRHRKHSDKLMPNIVNCATKIVKQGIDISKLDFPSERVVSLAFDVISHVLETGPGWRLVSPHFSSLMDSAIFPALVMNEKDISEWEEDPDEYLRRNLPSDLEEISGWREDLFTARKSAINLLGVISMSKGPPMSSNSSSASVKRKKSERIKARELRNSMGELLVLPFLSKFRVPCGATVVDAKVSKEYYGVLMAYGGLQDFLRERNREYTATLIRTRVLPLYSLSTCSPYLVAAANWVLGELASCLPEDMSENIYSSLLKALVMPDEGDVSCYPVRASAAGAIVELLENDYLPPEWLPLLQVVISRTDNEDDNESSILFQLLSTIVETGSDNVTVHIPYIVSTMVGVISKHIPPIPEPWPQVVERGFSAVAVMAQTLEDSMPEETEENEDSEKLMAGWGTCVRAFSVLLTQAWLTPGQTMEEDVTNQLPPTSCINDASIMLRSIMRFVTEAKEVLEMKVLELLTVWADLIADWHAWEELEDLSIFDCIKEVVYLCRKCEFKDIFMRRMLSPVPHRSIIENIAAFLSEAITQYPSATWRACSCVHLLLHIPDFSSEIKEVQQSLVATFTQAAFSRFREVESKPNAIWKPLLLVISSCYLFYPDIVEKVLKKDGNKGFMDWASGLSYISTSSFEPGLSAESEIKLIVMALVKVVERLLGPSGDPSCGLVRDCFISLMEAVIRLKEVKEEDENEDEEADEEEDDDEDEDEESDDDEDSEDDEREETEEEFLDRYAKASISLENGLDVEEGDIEDQDQELELGVLGKVDQEIVALSLIERYNHIFTNGQTLPPQVITGFLNTFPEHASLFSHA